MTTTTKKAAAKPAAAKPAAAAKEPAKKAPAKKAEPAEKKVVVPSYREAADFQPALKAAKSLAKDNGDLKSSLQLITHLAWKSPGAEISWAEATTPTVVEYATELGFGPGDKVAEALEATLKVAEKASASDAPAKEAVGVLAKVIRGHAA